MDKYRRKLYGNIGNYINYMDETYHSFTKVAVRDTFTGKTL